MSSDVESRGEHPFWPLIKRWNTVRCQYGSRAAVQPKAANPLRMCNALTRRSLHACTPATAYHLLLDAHRASQAILFRLDDDSHSIEQTLTQMWPRHRPERILTWRKRKSSASTSAPPTPSSP